MLCPKCSTEVPDAALFCPVCGCHLRNADDSLMLDADDSVTATRDNVSHSEASSSRTGDNYVATDTPQQQVRQPLQPKLKHVQQEMQQPKKKGKAKLPIAIALILMLAIAVALGLHFLKVIDLSTALPFLGEQKQEQAGSAPTDQTSNDDENGKSNGAGSESDASSSSSASSNSSSSSKSRISSSSQGDTSASNPKDSISLSSLTLSVDSGGRYVISGKVTNNADMEYTPKIEFTAVKHDKDRYGEETKEETSSLDLKTVSPNFVCDGNDMTALQLQPNETRDFAAYPEDWNSSDISYSDVKASIKEVTLPASVLNRFGYLVDFDNKSFGVSELSYSSSGVVTGSVTNNTKTYIESAYVSFTMLDAQGNTLPSVRDSTRPSGVLLYSAKVELLKPGDTVQFEKKVGEGFSSAKFVHIAYVPDESKNKLSQESA